MVAHYPIAVVQLFRFLRLFGISMFSVLEATDEHVRAVVAWEDGCERGVPDPDEIQEVYWQHSVAPMSEDALLVAEYAYDDNSPDTDRFKIDPDAVSRALGWNRERVDRATSELLKIRVDMVDDGEVTDGFQLHL